MSRSTYADLWDSPTGPLFTTGVELHCSFSQRCQPSSVDPDITVRFPVRQIPSCFFFFFFETGSPANSLSTKNVFLSTCSCHRNRIAALGLPTRYRACSTLQWKYSNSRGSPAFWATCFVVSARSNLSFAKSESVTHEDMYRVASSFFRI